MKSEGEIGAALKNGIEKNEDEILSAFRAYVRLWTYANALDHILRGIGCTAALGAGSAYPLMTIVFGSLINSFNNFALGLMSPAEFRSNVEEQRLAKNAIWRGPQEDYDCNHLMRI